MSRGALAATRAACPVCDGDAFVAAFIAYDRVVSREGAFQYRRCVTCGLLSQTPVPDEKALRGFYPFDYGPHETPAAPLGQGVRRRDHRPWNRVALRAFDAGRRRSALERLLLRLLVRPLARLSAGDLAAPRGDNRLLDIGCGAGEVMDRHRALGWEVRGVEPDPRAVAVCRARGLDVVQAGLGDAEFPAPDGDARFDVVMLKHVIEHVADPVRALLHAREMLAPGGLLIVITPNTSGIGLRAYQTCWYALDAPRHVHLFDAKNLRRLAARVGLRAERIQVRGSTRSLARSRTYARVQGSHLPPDLDARRAAVARGAADQQDATFRRLVGPAVALLAALGAGDTLCAHLVRDDP